MSFRSRLLVLSVTTPLLLFVVVGGFLNKVSARQGQGTYQPLRVFEDVVQLILGGYVEEVDVDHVMEGALRGLAGGLDPDSAYLTPELTRAVEGGAPLPAGDVGLILTRQYYLRVVAVRDGSPGAAAGLRTGDYIRAIDGRATRDMSVFEGTRALHGEPGTTVSLVIIRGNAAEPHTVDLVRTKKVLPATSDRMIRPDIGYVRLPAFTADLPDTLADRVEALRRAGATRVLLDLRGCAEGDLDVGIEAARRFVSAGTLAIRAERDDTQEVFTARDGDGQITVPITILTSRGTAGAAELFTAALQGNGRADVVGERTTGRAALQKLVPLPEQRGLWLTYARYLTPAGDVIHTRGLTPDEEVMSPDVDFGEPEPETDPILEAALARTADVPAAVS